MGSRPNVPNVLARTNGTRVVLASAVGAFGCFLLIQYLLETARFRAQVASVTQTYGLAVAHGLKPTTANDLVASSANFLAIGIGAVALASRGHRRAFVFPALLAVLLPWLADRLGVLTAYPLGQGWLNATGPWPWERFWVGALIDLTLALTPAVVLLSVEQRPVAAPADRPAGRLELEIASFAFCLYVLAVITWARGTLSEPASWQDPRALWAVVVPTCAFGVLFGLPQAKWLPVLVLVPLLAWREIEFGQGPPALWPTIGQVALALPLVGLTLLAAAWEPLSRGFALFRRSTIAMLVLLNALNVLDAMLTAFAQRSEQAAEVNPLVRLISLPGKILLVALAGWLLARIRPRVLIWPTLALAAVLVWHVAGLVVSSRLL